MRRYYDATLRQQTGLSPLPKMQVMDKSKSKKEDQEMNQTNIREFLEAARQYLLASLPVQTSF